MALQAVGMAYHMAALSRDTGSSEINVSPVVLGCC